MADKPETTPRPDAEQMENLLIRMCNGGIGSRWQDAIVRVLDGGNAPEILEGDRAAVDRHRRWMELNAKA